MKITEIETGEHSECIVLVQKMFGKIGKNGIRLSTAMRYWKVEESKKTPHIMDEPILSIDEEGNNMQAVYFITRKIKNEILELFRLTELFDALHTCEKDMTMQEAFNRFIEEKKEYIRPIAVVCIGRMYGKTKKSSKNLYAGIFLYKVPSLSDDPIEVEKPESLDSDEE